MSVKSLFRSFAGGEIAPELAGRLDLTKYQTGLATCRNMISRPHGPVTRRPGFEYIAEARDSTNEVRLIPFAFSATQTAVLEFGHMYVRFIVDGGLVTEAAITLLSIAGNLVTSLAAHSYATGDDVFIYDRFFRITVTGPATFTVADRWGAAAYPVAASSCARVYALATPYASADVMALHYAQDSDVVTITHPSYPAKELKRLSAANWTLTDVSFAPTLAAPAAPAGYVVAPTVGFPTASDYAMTAVAADGVTESLASTAITLSNDLSLQGNLNRLGVGEHRVPYGQPVLHLQAAQRNVGLCWPSSKYVGRALVLRLQHHPGYHALASREQHRVEHWRR